MTGTDCCYCTWGGDARFWTSFAPLGPWHPGVAPPLPTERCDLSGDWQSLAGSPDAPQGNETLTLTLAPGSDNFTFHDKNGDAAGWIDQSTGFVTFPPSAGDHRGVVTSADGSAAGCDRVRWYGYESFIWCRKGVSCALPSYRDAPEVNLCADGSQPHEDVRVNPCDPNDLDGTNFTVPAQQFNVIIVVVDDGNGGSKQEVLYYGERANSTPDGNFSHNFRGGHAQLRSESRGAFARVRARGREWASDRNPPLPNARARSPQRRGSRSSSTQTELSFP